MASPLRYRKTNWLNASFILLILVSLLVALLLAHRLTEKFIENEFSTQKIEVLEETLEPYNNFFHHKVPEISFYRGFLDATSARKYADSVFHKYEFVNSIVFYDAQLEVDSPDDPAAHPMAIPKSVYRFSPSPNRDSSIVIRAHLQKQMVTIGDMDEFAMMSSQLIDFIDAPDTADAGSADYLGTFYNIAHNSVTFMNMPLYEDIQRFKGHQSGARSSESYAFDIFTFALNPAKLKIVNQHPELYEQVAIKPLMYEDTNPDPDLITADLALSGPFADYKLFFRSSHSFLQVEVWRRFLPIAGVILLIYATLITLAYLIYRNLNINRKMFKLQYDFVNNLTHEFKTPVSVIKIAGNNIKSALKLSEEERRYYGKILDEEADKLNELMNKLLSFTQIENHSIEIHKERIDVQSFVSKLVNAYKLKYPDFNIEYSIKNVEFFDSDLVLITSLFQNLIDNAYKYSFPENKFIAISANIEKSFIVFRFKDKGIGIPQEEVKNVFKKFYRIQSQFNQQGSVGLGLAFCKELVNFLNGDIILKSKLGEGSEFTIKLPL